MENTLITSDRLNSLVELCKKTKAKYIAEVGVYKGGSLKYLAQNFPSAIIYGFDTFEGLPESQWNEREIHKPGDFNDTNLKSVEEFIDSKNVYLIKGLFPDCVHDEYGITSFDFVHIDTDFYESVKQSLEWFWPRMNEGSIIAFDDFEWPNCPGVKQALEEFGQPFFRSVDYQAYIIKQ
jgi:O-methyltransferase